MEFIMRFGFRSTFKSLFNVRSWIAWNSLRDNASFIRGAYQSILKSKPKYAKPQTFSEAVQQYGYTEEFLKQQHEKFLFASRAYLCALTVGCSYLGWLAYTQAYLSAAVMLPFNFLLFSFYFRESFWAMQVEKRKLGLSFIDWVNGHLG
jgi:hypothetical protein